MRWSKIIALGSGIGAVVILLVVLVMVHAGYTVELYENIFIILAVEIYLGIFSIPVLIKMLIEEAKKC